MYALIPTGVRKNALVADWQLLEAGSVENNKLLRMTQVMYTFPVSSCFVERRVFFSLQEKLVLLYWRTN